MMRKISLKEEMGGHIINAIAINLKNSKHKKNIKIVGQGNLRDSCITLNTHDISMRSSGRKK